VRHIYFSEMLLKSVFTKYPQLLSTRNISYVQRARLLEKIKNDDDFCKESMLNGKFLLYNKGQPLLKRGSGPGDHHPQYVDFKDCSQVCPDVLNSSVALSVSEEGQPIFATMMAKEADPIHVETKTLATESWSLPCQSDGSSSVEQGLVIADVEQKEQVLWSLWIRTGEVSVRKWSQVSS